MVPSNISSYTHEVRDPTTQQTSVDKEQSSSPHKNISPYEVEKLIIEDVPRKKSFTSEVEVYRNPAYADITQEISDSDDEVATTTEDTPAQRFKTNLTNFQTGLLSPGAKLLKPAAESNKKDTPGQKYGEKKKSPGIVERGMQMVPLPSNISSRIHDVQDSISQQTTAIAVRVKAATGDSKVSKYSHSLLDANNETLSTRHTSLAIKDKKDQKPKDSADETSSTTDTSVSEIQSSDAEDIANDIHLSSKQRRTKSDQQKDKPSDD